MPDFCLEGPIDTKLDSRRRSSHIRRHPRNNNNTTAAATALQLTYPPPAKCMQKLFTCKISVCLLGAATAMQAILPPACILNYSYGPLHVHASRALRHACRAGRPSKGVEGVERKKACTKPSANPVADPPWCKQPTRIIRALRATLTPRYKSLAKGTCELPSHSLGSIVITLCLLLLLQLKIGQSCC